MSICQIYDKQEREVISFSLDDPRWNGSISVGRSPKCAVSLEILPKDSGVADSHFAIVKGPEGWMIVSAAAERPVKVNGEETGEAALNENDVVEFGSCRMVVAPQPRESDFILTLSPDTPEEARYILRAGSNSVGAAESCDIVIRDAELIDRHAIIAVDGQRLTLENLAGENGAYVNGARVTGKRQLKADDVLSMGEARARIDLKVSDNLYDIIFKDPTPEQKRWFLACFAGIAVVLILLMTFVSIHMEDSQSQLITIEKRVASEPFSDNMEQRVVALVKAGKPRQALKLLDNAIVSEKDKEKADALKKNLRREYRAVKDLKYYGAKLKRESFDNIYPTFVKSLLASGDSDVQLSRSVDYWNSAIQQLSDARKNIANARDKSYKKLGDDSYFYNNITPVKEKVDKLIKFYAFLNEINIFWDRREWNRLTEILTDKNARNLIQEKRMGPFSERLLKISRFGEHLNKAYKDFERSTLETLNIPSLNTDITELKRELQQLQTDPITPYHEFSARLSALSRLIALTNDTRDLYRKWEDDPENVTTVSQLGRALRTMTFQDPPLSLFNDAVDVIDDKVFCYIDSRLKEDSARIDRQRLKNLDKWINYARLLVNTPDNARLASLASDRTKLTQAIEKRCDALSYKFNKARGKGDYQTAKVILNQVLEIAPENGRYHLWAKSEIRALNEASNSPANPKTAPAPAAKKKRELPRSLN